MTNGTALKKKLWAGIAAAFAFGALAACFLVWRGAPVTFVTEAAAVQECATGDAVQNFRNCGAINADGVFIINRALLKKIRFRGTKPACLMAAGRAFYLTRQGRTSQAYVMDVDCDGFQEGLARSPTPLGTQFVDRSLKLVIATPYSFAKPFEQGLAVVCNDLRVRHAFGDEHGEYAGGQCGFIDRTGTLVVPLDYSYDEVEAHRPNKR